MGCSGFEGFCMFNNLKRKDVTQTKKKDLRNPSREACREEH